MNLKKLKIKIRLYFTFLKWCVKDIRDNYIEMKSCYLMETDPELLEIQDYIKGLIKKNK
jgi:hypothetical protein